MFDDLNIALNIALAKFKMVVVLKIWKIRINRFYRLTVRYFKAFYW